MTPISAALVPKQVYTRQDPIEGFGSTDVTVSNGIFFTRRANSPFGFS